MKYESGKVANLPAIKTLEQFLLDNEYENVINFAPLINKQVIYYKLNDGKIKLAIQYNDSIKIDDIELCIVKQVINKKLVNYAILDSVSGQLIVLKGKSTIKNIKIELAKVIKPIGKTEFIKTIKAASSITQAMLKNEFLKTI